MGRGGPRNRAGRPVSTPGTVRAAVGRLEALLGAIKRQADHLDTPTAQAFARRVIRDAMRLRRRLLEQGDPELPSRPQSGVFEIVTRIHGPSPAGPGTEIGRTAPRPERAGGPGRP
jgi:hypothetical protein